MFHLYHHHDLTRLADVLTALRRTESVSPLAPDRVLVPNVGLGRWLKMHIAERDGIAANIETLLPAPFFWDIVAGSLPGERPDSSAYRRENLRWHLYAHLPAIAAEVPEVARYLDERPMDLRRWQLAAQLANLFDQYLIYRREMLLRWERGDTNPDPPGSWQAPLWRALVARLGNHHRARLLGELIERVETGAPLETTTWPERLYCFGLGNLPPDYLRLLYAMGRHADVHFLMHNPSDVYWGDIEKRPTAALVPLDGEPLPGEGAVFVGHPLLASLGYAARDFLRLIYSDEFSAIREFELGEALAYQPPGDDTLLHRLQSGVIRMDATPTDAGIATGDRSFQVHACHGVLREVQVLHDQLLDLLAADPSLEPRDIIVMTPDVAAFAPAIASVFGAADGPAAIPFNLSDRPRRGTHPIVLTFRALLDLPLWRWTASELASLVAVPAVMRHYDFDEADVVNVERWIGEAGIRWGMDADHREHTGAGHWAQNSWEFGLDRLLAGVAVSNPEALPAGVAPVIDLEGGATMALGELWLLVERLRRWRTELASPASAAGWRERLNNLCADLFAVDQRDRDEQLALDTVSEALTVLGNAAQALGDEPLPWDVVRDIVDGELDATGARQPFLAGGVTFCGLVPLRSVPFRVVCLLGMNDGAFPRRDNNRAINLIRQNPRLGDSSARDDDRLLLLQWLLAAVDVFYLSYAGQDTHSGEDLEPSTAVAELLDFVAHNQFAGTDRKAALTQLVTRQPMQPFSPRYFSGAGHAERSGGPADHVFTFRGDWRPAALALFGDRADALPLLDGSRAPAPEVDQLSLDELKRFFRHPARYFFQEVLQLELETSIEQHRDDEPLELNALEQHELRRLLFDSARSSGLLPETPPERIRALGLLPPPPLDAAPYAAAAGAVNELLPVWAHLCPAAPDDVIAVDVTLANGIQLVGRLGDVGPGLPGSATAGAINGLYRIEPRRISSPQLLPHWIDLLALAACGDAATLLCCGLNGEGRAALSVAFITPELAQSHLNSLTDLYLEGQQRPLCFLPRLAEEYIEALNNERISSPSDALRRCNDRLNGTFHRHWVLDDPWFRPVLGPPPYSFGADPEESEYCRLALAVIEPLHAALLPQHANQLLVNFTGTVE